MQHSNTNPILSKRIRVEQDCHPPTRYFVVVLIRLGGKQISSASQQSGTDPDPTQGSSSQCWDCGSDWPPRRSPNRPRKGTGATSRGGLSNIRFRSGRPGPERTSIGGRRVAQILERIVAARGLPESILSDKGPEFVSKAMDAWAYGRGIKHQFIEPGKPTQNAYIESFNGKLRPGCRRSSFRSGIRRAACR